MDPSNSNQNPTLAVRLHSPFNSTEDDLLRVYLGLLEHKSLIPPHSTRFTSLTQRLLPYSERARAGAMVTFRREFNLSNKGRPERARGFGGSKKMLLPKTMGFKSSKDLDPLCKPFEMVEPPWSTSKPRQPPLPVLT